MVISPQTRSIHVKLVLRDTSSLFIDLSIQLLCSAPVSFQHALRETPPFAFYSPALWTFLSCCEHELRKRATWTESPCFRLVMSRHSSPHSSRSSTVFPLYSQIPLHSSPAPSVLGLPSPSCGLPRPRWRQRRQIDLGARLVMHCVASIELEADIEPDMWGMSAHSPAQSLSPASLRLYLRTLTAARHGQLLTDNERFDIEAFACGCCKVSLSFGFWAGYLTSLLRRLYGYSGIENLSTGSCGLANTRVQLPPHSLVRDLMLYCI